MAFEADIRKKMTLMLVLRNSVFPSVLLTNSDQDQLRTCSQLTRLALRAYLKDYYRQQAALGDPEARALMTDARRNTHMPA